MGDRTHSRLECRVAGCEYVLKFVKGPDGKMLKPDRILVAGHLMMVHAYQAGEAHQMAGLRTVK